MGCLVPRTGITYLENKSHAADQRIADLEVSIMTKQSKLALNELSETEPLGYLIHQEQIREDFVLSKLNLLFPSELKEFPTEPYFKKNINNYLSLKQDQTSLENTLINTLFKSIEKITELNDEMRTSIDIQLESLVTSNQSKLQNSEKLMKLLKRRTSRIIDSVSLENLIDTFLRRAELDREIALIQRIYEFRQFVEQKNHKESSRFEAEKEVKDMQMESKNLRTQCVELKSKEKDLRRVTRVQTNLLSGIELDILKARHQRSELEKQLEEDNTGELEAVERDFEEKQGEIIEIEEAIRKMMKEIADMKEGISLEAMKTREKDLKREINEVQKQVEALYSQKMQSIKEKNRLRQIELENKAERAKELENSIKLNQDRLLQFQKPAFVKLKKIIIYQLSLPTLLSKAFHTWKSFTTQLIQAPQLGHLPAWPAKKLYDFIEDFLKQKYKLDSARWKRRQPPKKMETFLRLHIKKFFKSTNEVEKEIEKMTNSLLLEEKINLMAKVIKKMLRIGEDKVPYHVSVLLTNFWIDFDYIKIIEDERGSCYLSDFFSLIEDYIEQKDWNVAIKLIEAIRPENMSDVEYFLLVFNHKFVTFRGRNSLNFSSFEEFISTAIEKTSMLIDKGRIEAALKDLSLDSFEKLYSAAETIDKNKFIVKKPEVLSSILSIYSEICSSHIKALEEKVSKVQHIGLTEFKELVSSIDPSIDAGMSLKLFTECSLPKVATPDSVISPEVCVETLLKYGIGELGIGPFKHNTLKSILSQVLKKEKTGHHRKPSDLIPYKVNIEEIEDSEDILNLSDISDISPQLNFSSDFKASKSTVIPSPRSSLSPTSSLLNSSQKSITTSKFFNSRRVVSPFNYGK